MSVEYQLGFIVGLVIALVIGGGLIWWMLRYTKKDGKMKCQFDERQEQARGKGFKYGFFAHLLYSAVISFCDILEIQLPLEDSTKGILGIIVAIFVFVLYCIRKQAYVSLNENAKRLTIVFTAIGAINLISGISAIIHGNIIENGVLSTGSVNLLLGALLIFIAVFMNVGVERAED